MTDFSTEILPEEEEKVEELLPNQEDAQKVRKVVETLAEPKDKPYPALSSAGNAALAWQLGKPKEQKAAGKSPPNVEVKKTKTTELRNENQPELTPTTENPVPEMAATPAPLSIKKHPEPEPMLNKEAEQPEADPVTERQDRLRLLTQTLARLLKNPEKAPIDALFTAFLKAPRDEQADAALAIANAVLRIDADTRRRARIVLTRAMTVHKLHPLAQILAIRLGAWVATRPAPPPPPDPGGGP